MRSSTQLTRQFLFAFVLSAIFVAAGCSRGNTQTDDKSGDKEQSKQAGSKQEESGQGHAGHGDKKYTNALVNETSPYLLMHAHNPVNWYGWNEATLAQAKKEDKAIFLSIGYSSCHWCHVMERESFLDEEIAKFLNENFICIKVDREERPDVDEIYMHALMEIKPGRGGWPLSMFMTPDAKPFYGGTYWPARDGDRGASNGFLTIVKKVDEHYRNNRLLVNKDAEMVAARTKKALSARSAKKLPIQKSWLNETIDRLSSSFDAAYGGFGFSATNPNQPKFPEPSNLFFFIDQIKNNPDDAKKTIAKNMLVKTCEGMMMGGIYDHLGGGFHRYSVDRFWHIPHFEKMLYDNGQLATVYAEAYELTGREEFKRVVEGILKFVDRELIAESGGIYSSLDADSEGEEGKFYRWELKEIKEALSNDEYTLFAEIYGLNNPPNFEGEYYAPLLNRMMSDHAKEKSTSLSELESKLEPIRKKLFDIRAKRVRPLLDTKILTAWNGLMIRGYADAGRILKNDSYVETAAKAADFALKNLTNAEGRLYRTHTDGEARLNAYVIDYACLVDALIAIHKATGDAKWLNEADKLQTIQDDLFWDEEGGGYFYTSKNHEVLLARSKRTVDGAMPSGNSISASNLIYLSQALVKNAADGINQEALTKKADAYRNQSNRTLLASAEILMRAPHAAPRMLISTKEFIK
ncbi:MAG: thioredoxin domain-containing protein [Mariniblastus sp.]